MTETFAEFEKKGWSQTSVAKNYTADAAKATHLCVPALVKASKSGPGKRVVDLCCGPGIVTQGLVDSGAEAVGVDFSPPMLELARASVDGASFVEGDVGCLDFDDASFDAATMGFGILHVPDAGQALAEASRILKPGGTVAWSCWHGPEKISILPTFFAACMEHGDPKLKLPSAAPAYFYAQPENAIPIMEAAGFKDIRFETVDTYWLCSEPHDPIRYFQEGTVRGAAVLNGQPEANKRAISTVVSAWVEDNCARGENGKWHVPIPAVVVSGSLPS